MATTLTLYLWDKAVRFILQFAFSGGPLSPNFEILALVYPLDAEQEIALTRSFAD
jgi:hypothetical protein